MPPTPFILITILAASSLWTPQNVVVLVSAQTLTPAPIPASRTAYATHAEKTLFIQGGASANSHYENQFFSLDLTQSWNTSNPSWKVLPIGGGTASAPVEYGLAMAISNDGRTLMEWGARIGISTYDIQEGSWVGIGVPQGVRTGFFGYVGATDPNTGLVYIPSVLNGGATMMVYDFVTGSTTAAPMPPMSMLNRPVGNYAWAWNTPRQSMLLHGGANYGNGNDPFINGNLAEYSPITSRWTQLFTTGQTPPALTDHCMVSALGGSKMIIYGGTTLNSTVQGDIYILDVATMAWTKGAAPGPAQYRRNMACTVAGNNFVVWGGQTTNSRYMETAVYDLRTDQWTDQFIIQTQPKTGGATSPKSDRGRIIGIAVGVSASLAIVIFALICLYCRKRKQRWTRLQKIHVNKPTKTWRGGGGGPTHRTYNDKGRDPQETSLQHRIFEQERKSQEKNISRSNSENSLQLLSPTTSDGSETVVTASLGSGTISQEEWLQRQRAEVNQERQALALMQMQETEYWREMEAIRNEAFTRG
ncbi:hypothetical protein BGX33_004856 [Mortierella sp. NVP41]|nr:hypothetical protein BGX33_004856 [Mortierella sp. NVP41]